MQWHTAVREKADLETIFHYEGDHEQLITAN